MFFGKENLHKNCITAKEIMVANHFNIDFNIIRVIFDKIDKMIYRVDVHWYTNYSLNKSFLYNNCKKEPHISSQKIMSFSRLTIRAICYKFTCG